jgi:predicted anti-sigma-YlaC factor YlaD
MKCFLIRDLLPLYIEGDCSPMTKRFVDDHLTSCHECKEMFELMNDPIDFKEAAAQLNMRLPVNGEVLRKYYGRLIAKGIAGFLFIYIMIVSIAFFI